MTIFALTPTHQLRTNDLVYVRGAVLRLGKHTVEKISGYDRHTFKTEVADYGDWPFARKDLKDFHVIGDHLMLWARINIKRKE